MAIRQLIQTHGVTTGVTEITAIPAPADASIVHKLVSLVVTNKDTQDVCIIVQMADGSTNREISHTSLNAGVSATGTLTFSGNAANNETVEINGKTYTFKTSIGSADGEVDVGANQAASEDQLTAAINLGSGGGTKYTSQTTAHPSVTAADVASTVVVTAIATGAAGNSMTISEGMGSGDWGASVMAGGEDPGRLVLLDPIGINSTTKSLEILLAWPVRTTECDYVVTYSREPATTLPPA